jgi:amino acid adenylation domain-containing protein
MSDVEKGMIFHSLKDPVQTPYHIQSAYYIKDRDFTQKRFLKAMILMVDKHPILRTGFNLNDYEEPIQIVYRDIPLEIPNEDISHLEKSEAEKYVKGVLEEERNTPFDVHADSVLWRIKTYILDNENICVLWICHHAIIDGWSSASLLTELHNTYFQLKTAPDYVPPKLKCTYKDFVIDQLVEKKKGKSTDFWQRELGGYKRLEFFSPPQKSVKDGFQPKEYYTRHLGEKFPEELTYTAKIHQTSVKYVCFAAYLYMLNMVSYEDDIVVGFVTNNRPDCEDGDKVIGCFLNTIPVRVKIPPRTRCSDYIRMIDDKMLELKQYDRLSFFEIARLSGERTGEENPIFDTLFDFSDFHVYRHLRQPAGQQEVLSPGGVSETHTRFDCYIDATFEEFKISLVYRLPLVSQPMIEKMYGYFEEILKKFIYKPGSFLEKKELIPAQEKRKILYELNDTAARYPGDKTVHNLFREQVERNPNRTALVGKGTSVGTRFIASAPGKHTVHLTYNQLNRKSHQLAHLLLERGVQPDTIVGLIVERSIEMIVGIIGILKAGGAYLPIEPGYPGERIGYMLDDSSAGILLTTPDLSGEITFGKEILHLPDAINRVPTPHLHLSPAPVSSLAYVMYTSGSTGGPKGVMVEHRNVVRLVKNANFAELSGNTRILQTGAPVFDATTFEIWGSLLNGGELHLVSNEVILDADCLRNALERYRIDTLWLSSPLFNQLTRRNSDLFPGLKYLLVGGDVLSPGHINRVRHRFPGLRVINGYGPTENTTFSLTHLIDKDYQNKIPIGKPIANSTVYVLDRHYQLVPMGAAGELFVGGDGLARGYLNNPELTSEKFVRAVNRRSSLVISSSELSPNDQCPMTNDRLYKTGDLGRWQPDGNIEFLGRIDHQVKIRGFRIEPGEIENQLLKHPDIKEAAVLCNEHQSSDKSRHLCAFAVSDQELDTSLLKEFLSGILPGYMIPSLFVQVNKIPLTSNGKIDRQVLLEMDANRPGEDYQAPKDIIQKKLADIFAGILGLNKDHIGIAANFFESGGHSLNAITLLSAIHREFQIKLTLPDIFQHPGIRELAECIKKGTRESFIALEPAEEKEYYPLSASQKRFYILQQTEPANISNNLPIVFELKGKLDIKRLKGCFLGLIARHDSLRTFFEVVGNKAVQRIKNKVEFDIEYYRMKGGDQVCLTTEARKFMQDFIRPFDLSQLPLFRVGLVQVGKKNTRHLLMLDFHHIISDGLSMHIFFNQLAAWYEGNQPPCLRLQYKDFSQWQTSPTQVEKIGKQREYWLSQFQDNVPRLNLPTDYERPQLKGFKGDSVKFEIPAGKVKALKDLAFQEDASLYMVLFSIYSVLLAKLSGQEDMVAATAVLGRRHPDLNQIIGLFFYTLPIRTAPQNEKPFDRFLKEVKQRLLEAYENQDYTVDELVGCLTEKGLLVKDRSHNPLFDTMCSLQNFQLSEESPGDQPGELTLTPVEYRYQTAKFDLFMIVTEAGDRVRITLEYSTDLFKHSTVLDMINYYLEISDRVLNDVKVKLKDISISLDVMDAKSDKSYDDYVNFGF